MARRQRAASSAFCGLIAVLCRQSNIVWAAFAALQLLSLQFYSQTKNIDNVKSEATVFFRYLLQWTWVYACLPFLLLAGAFFAFLVWNKGIVVGDRSNHIAILHVPQMLYFCLFTLAHLAPSLITQRRAVFDIFAFWRRHLFLFICSCAALTVVIHQFTFVDLCLVYTFSKQLIFYLKFRFVHPFILADNRHFTFYIWRLLFQRPLTRYGLIPIYIFAVSFMIHTLRNATRLWQLGFWLCSAAALIPTPLLEPRYFIVPLLLFQLQARETQSIFNLLVYIVVDLIVLTLFVARPFQWADGSIARFMY
jgi:alpha-1,2-glucosyltransferase